MKMLCGDRERSLGPDAGGQQGRGPTPSHSLREGSALVHSKFDAHPTGLRHTEPGTSPPPRSLSPASAQPGTFIFPQLLLRAGFKAAFRTMVVCEDAFRYSPAKNWVKSGGLFFC